MGSPDFAVPLLEGLAESDAFDVVQVVTQPDRPKGRGKKLTPTAVKSRAVEHGLPVVEMSRDNYGEIVEALRKLEPGFIVVAAFGVILKRDLLSLPSHGCINLHASLLPRHRGVSPIQASLLAGDLETGCTTMRMDEGIDTGDILLAASTPIEDTDTAGSLEKRLADLGAPLVLQTLSGILSGDVHGEKQDETLANYTRKIRKEHGRIDWSRDAVEIWRQVRAMSPWPSAHTEYGGKRLIVLESAAGEGASAPGVVASVKPLRVGTGHGVLELVSVKLAGGKAMNASAFVSGYGVTKGEKLG
jgi:methionyl-tRNA formyltransferase